MIALHRRLTGHGCHFVHQGLRIAASRNVREAVQKFHENLPSCHSWQVSGYRTHGIGFLAEFFDLKSHLRKTAAVFEEQLFFLHAQVQNNRRRQHLGLEGPVPQIFHKTLI